MSERRRVTVAQGHTVTVRRTGVPSDRPGFVRVKTTHRAPFDIAERLWNEAPVACR
jgi:hypothetical protein